MRSCRGHIRSYKGPVEKYTDNIKVRRELRQPSGNSDYVLLARWHNGNASKPHISKMHNVQETQNNVSNQTRNRVFATSICVILIDFAFES